MAFGSWYANFFLLLQRYEKNRRVINSGKKAGKYSQCRSLDLSVKKFTEAFMPPSSSKKDQTWITKRTFFGGGRISLLIKPIVPEFPTLAKF
jgi:hypothetical protein